MTQGVFDDAYDARVAGQAADGLWGEIRAVVQMTAALAVKLNQRFRGNMHLHFGVSGAGDSMHQRIGAVNARGRLLN